MRTRIAISRFWVADRSFWHRDDDPGRVVGQADGGLGLLDVLAAGARRSERVDPDLVPVELDRDVLVRLGHDLDEREGRLAALLRVVRADADEPVDAALRHGASRRRTAR